MYRHILVPVEHSDADKTVVAHAQDLARTAAELEAHDWGLPLPQSPALA